MPKSSPWRLHAKYMLKKIGAFISELSDRLTYHGVIVVEEKGEWFLCRTPNAVWKLNITHGIDNEIIRTGSFEPRSIQLIQKLVLPGMHVADIGANFGYYTVQLSQLVGQTGFVHAFEPSETFRARLLEHLELNRCANVAVNDFGLSDKEGRLSLKESDDTATFHWWYGDQKERATHDVTLHTFDWYANEKHLTQLDFIKVDIDGHEPNFIRGAQATISRYRPIILIEFMQLALTLNNNSDVEQLAQQIKSLGYDLYSEKTGKRFTTRHEFLLEAMNTTFSTNILCMPSDRLYVP